MLVRFSCQLNGVDELALTKLDVLDKLPLIKLCTGYSTENILGGEFPAYWSGDTNWLSQCKPIYEEFEGWMQSIRQVRRFKDLPSPAKKYVMRIQELIEVPITHISVGPNTSETIEIS